MDKFSRLQALTGEVLEEEPRSEPFMFPQPAAKHLYEGTDSEGDETVTSRLPGKNRPSSESVSTDALYTFLFELRSCRQERD